LRTQNKRKEQRKIMPGFGRSYGKKKPAKKKPVKKKASYARKKKTK
jgi:hypothetical protein